MNICFIQGKIKSKIEYKFFYKSKKISIARTKIEIENKNIIIIKGYNNIADWMYQHLKQDDIICIQGKIDSKMEIEIEQIYFLKPI